MKKLPYKKSELIMLIGICAFAIFIAFVTKGIELTIFLILASISVAFEEVYKRLPQSQQKCVVVELVSAFRFVFIGCMLDLSFMDRTAPTLPNFFQIVVLVYLLFGVLAFSMISLKTNLSVPAVSVILLNIMLVYAMLYDVIYYFDPLAFNGTTNFCCYPFIDFLYYSIVTFTTLGYGDIVPETLIAKLLSASEAFVFSCMIAFAVMNFGKQINGKKEKEITKKANNK